jgi:glycine hydroxymethyltransferase
MSSINLKKYMDEGIELLRQYDPVLYDLLAHEHRRQMNSLTMVAASSIADPSVLMCESMAISNTTTEGYPGARFHAGCEVADEIERLAIERAKTAFRAQYANVQPHSGTTANQVVLFSLLKPGDTILGLELNSGGHLTHGSKASVSGQYFNAMSYGLTQHGLIDYDEVYRLAQQFRPKLIISGASAYPRTIDFKRFRSIADSVGAFLLADISHIAGLVATGEHPSPIDDAHFTTTSTYKQLYGPRGGMILMGKDHDSSGPDGKTPLHALIQKGVFPFVQGTPNLNSIAAKARALAMVSTEAFRRLARAIVVNAKVLANCFIDRRYCVLTGGTDNHIVLIDVLERGLTGLNVECALEACNIIVNKNRIPGDTKSPLVTSGVRIGTNSLTLRGFRESEMHACAELIHIVLSSIKPYNDRYYNLDEDIQRTVKDRVQRLCDHFPIPHYQST